MIQLREVSKHYAIGNERIVGLQDVSLEINPGDLVILRGASGSGKTTLLLTVGGMQHPTSGTVSMVGTEDLYALSPAKRTDLRARHIGFIFQLFHLVPYLNVLDNIQLGAVASSNSRAESNDLIERLGLAHRRSHKPAQLSVGECQRVAIARALVSHPDVILADEPTGNLDEGNAKVVIETLQEFCQGGGALLLATHGETSAMSANRYLTIEAGVVQQQTAAR